MTTLKYSRQRESIKNYLATTKEHPTADTVYLQMKKEFPTEEEIFQPQQLQFKVKKERPATSKQKKYLENLMKYHAIGECLDIDQMTQREASKKIDHIILNYGVMKK